MGFFTAAAATTAAAAGTYMKGQAEANAAKGQAALGEYNAAVAEKDAKATEAKTQFDRIRQVLAGDRKISSIRVGNLSENVMHIVAAQAAENEMQNALIGYAGKIQADRHRSRAAGYRAGAKFAEMRADNIKTATLINTGSSLLGNVGAMYDQGMFTSATPAAATTQSSIQDQRMAHYSNL